MSSTSIARHPLSKTALAASLLLHAIVLVAAAVVFWPAEAESNPGYSAASLTHQRLSRAEERSRHISHTRRAAVLGTGLKQRRIICGCGGCSGPLLSDLESPTIDLPVPELSSFLGAGNLSPQHLTSVLPATFPPVFKREPWSIPTALP